MTDASDQALDQLARQRRAAAAADHLDKVSAEIDKRKEVLREIAKGDESNAAITPIPSPNPILDAERYVREKWMQNVAAMRTNCFRCRNDSPVIYVPVGTIAFGEPLRSRGEVDITEYVIIEFDKIGWKFQKRRAYCPACKGLGSV